MPALLVFLLLHGVFFYDVVAGGRSFSAASYTAGLAPDGPLGDRSAPPHLLDVEGAAWVDEPSPHLAYAAVAAGELPLWSARSGLGAPLAANLNSGAGNPLQLPLNLLPSPWAADLFHLGRLLLLALFTFALLRELALAPIAATVGAVVTAYGGYALAWVAHHPLSSELFLPLMLLGFERGRRGRRAGWILLVLAVAGSLLGGKLQSTLLCLGFLTVHAVHRASPRTGGAGTPTVVATIGGILLGILVAAYLLVPAAELMTRASGLTLGGRAQLAGYTVPWPSLVSLALPRLFVAPGHAFAPGLPLTPAIGAVALVLAAMSTVARAAPLCGTARLYGCWALVFLLRNAGAFGDLATRLPAVRGILFVKYTFTAVFALALMAAIALDALVGGRVRSSRAVAAVVAVLVGVGVLAGLSLATPTIATFPSGVLPAAIPTAGLLLGLGLWRAGVIGGRALGTAAALLVVAELWSLAPHRHPPRLDPYRPPAFVQYLQQAPPGRVIADPDLAAPLTSAAAGLHDLRAIDVLTPGSYYAFFLRLVSFCDRVIHFTADPDVTLAATAPALDLAGVRYVATRQPLDFHDLDVRVRTQVGRERTARLLADLTRLRTAGTFAIGPVAIGDDVRFAFTLTTPFELDVSAQSEAGVLAFGALARGSTAGAHLFVAVAGAPSDASEAPLVIDGSAAWHEHEIALGNAGTRRHIRLRLRGESVDGTPTAVSLGHLGFGPGAAAERRVTAERTGRHRLEVAALSRVFDDAALGVTVYENQNALPRAFRVAEVEPTGSLEAALTRLGDGFDFRRAALVPLDDVAAVTAALGRAGDLRSATDPGSTAIRAETPSSVVVATDGAAPALLVLADLAYPGWRATLDGRAAPVLTVDGVLRGVVVPAGPHVVAFRYRPTSVLIGSVLSLLGLLAAVLHGRWSARRHGDAA